MSPHPTLKKAKIPTPVGLLHVAFDDQSIHYCLWDFEVSDVEAFQSAREAKKHPLLDEIQLQLKEYFTGKRKEFNLPICLKGTDFQVKTWQALTEIPYGETASYSDQAKKMNRPSAIRAVGTANSRNPICLIVPCHRVTRADKTLGGYAGGVQIKRQLLDLESSFKNIVTSK